jgi:metal-dependent amidase/aminoacylase/carboxypeptidase family protein
VLLKAREAELPGTVVLLFQPAEEGGAGGKRFVEEGALKGVLGVHGIHVWPGLTAGTVASRASPFTFLVLQARSKYNSMLG